MTNKEIREVAIEVISLGKAYRKYERKRDAIKSLVTNSTTGLSEKWAVRKIEFQLAKGESMGIIGMNGSGKSTLLQMICGTIKPTEGIVKTKGKISALLELGSGFNPEFTGIENIYLNAAIQGMSKKEVEERMNMILEFAGIGDAIMEPVKTYSSGMIVRLAFAVMANIDADILIIDEALAVGDSLFTQKCMRYIQRIRRDKALIFVSHDANTILSLCDRAVLLKKGRIKKMGSPKEVIEEYTRDIQNQLEEDSNNEFSWSREEQNTAINEENIEAYKRRWQDYRMKAIERTKNKNNIEIVSTKQEDLNNEDINNGDATIKEVKLMNVERKIETNQIEGGEVCLLRIRVKCNDDIKNPIVGFILKNSRGLVLLGDNTLNALTGDRIEKVESGKEINVNFMFTMPLLPKDKYSVTASVASGNNLNHRIIHWVNDIIMLESRNQSLNTGLAGVAMHAIEIEVER